MYNKKRRKKEIERQYHQTCSHVSRTEHKYKKEGEKERDETNV